MKSKYTSSKSVAKNQTVPISADDPRLAWNKAGATKARQGAEIEIVGLDGKALIVGGRNLTSASSNTGTDNNKYVTEISLPPINNQPPIFYPGGSGSYVIIPTDPGVPTVAWSGEDLIVQFAWDYSNELNKTISQFILEVTADGVTRSTALNTFLPNKTQSAQSLVFSKGINSQLFGVLRTNISSVCVIAADPLNNVSNSVCATSVPAYVIDLPTPTITVTAINSGYSVAFATPTQASYNAIEIVEYESTDSTEPTGVTYTRSYFGTINPANIISSSLNARWVKARFLTDSGAATPFSAASKVTPTSAVGVDLTPPNEASNISTSWDGDDISIDYKLPSQDAGSRIQVQLTAPNTAVGYFYRFPDGSGRDQTLTITKKDLFDQFGEHYSSFTGILRSIDTSDNRSSGVSFNVAARANPLLNVTPTFTLTPLTNGYSVFATNYASSVGVNYMEVYAKHTPWSGDPVNDDYVVYAGANPAVIIDTDYTTVYVKIHYYDDFGNTSLYSVEDTVTPLNAGEITSFENPISFGTNAVIYAGGDYQSGKRTVFKADGIFAYDATANAAPTTQIIADASAGTPTFITTQAQIADWIISETKIENTLSGAPDKYTGLSATGDYAFWAGSDTSGGDTSAKFSVTPDGNVIAREISIVGNGNPLSNLISAGGLFTVKNDGSFTATSAEITGNVYAVGGEFTGNVKLNGGSLYALGTGGTVSSGKRTVFNSAGIAAFNGDGGYAQMLTAPLTDGSVFSTTAANIGGWKVSASSISKSAGDANISLDSANGYIYVSSSNVADNRAGINSPTVLNDSVFWAGGTSPNASTNPFRVTLDGTLHATSANITGTITSTGSLSQIKMDGTDGYISLTTANNLATSYLVPRNGNIYLTSPSTTAPWAAGSTKPIGSDGPVSGTYFSAGASFKDPWNNTANGIGLFTGAWNYFAGGSSSPFISLTKNSASKGAIQLSASPKIGMLIEEGGSTNDAFTAPTILIYTANNGSGSNYSPATAYGAWARFTENNINLSASSQTFIDLNSTTERIVINASNDVVDITGVGITTSEDQAYESSSRIVMDPVYGVVITGIQVQKNIDVSSWALQDPDTGGENYVIPPAGIRYKNFEGTQDLVGDGTTSVRANGSYRNSAPLGRYPRQRMLVEDPVTGQVMLGMGIYYKPVAANQNVPSSSTGYAGDLLVQY